MKHVSPRAGNADEVKAMLSAAATGHRGCMVTPSPVLTHDTWQRIRLLMGEMMSLPPEHKNRAGNAGHWRAAQRSKHIPTSGELPANIDERGMICPVTN
ncbi:TPA: hypothetical protein ACHKVO_004782 [Escherichia coli]